MMPFMQTLPKPYHVFLKQYINCLERELEGHTLYILEYGSGEWKGREREVGGKGNG